MILSAIFLRDLERLWSWFCRYLTLSVLPSIAAARSLSIPSNEAMLMQQKYKDCSWSYVMINHNLFLTICTSTSFRNWNSSLTEMQRRDPGAAQCGGWRWGEGDLEPPNSTIQQGVILQHPIRRLKIRIYSYWGKQLPNTICWFCSTSISQHQSIYF